MKISKAIGANARQAIAICDEEADTGKWTLEVIAVRINAAKREGIPPTPGYETPEKAFEAASEWLRNLI